MECTNNAGVLLIYDGFVLSDEKGFHDGETCKVGSMIHDFCIFYHLGSCELDVMLRKSVLFRCARLEMA